MGIVKKSIKVGTGLVAVGTDVRGCHWLTRLLTSMATNTETFCMYKPWQSRLFPVCEVEMCKTLVKSNWMMMPLHFFTCSPIFKTFLWKWKHFVQMSNYTAHIGTYWHKIHRPKLIIPHLSVTLLYLYVLCFLTIFLLLMWVFIG